MRMIPREPSPAAAYYGRNIRTTGNREGTVEHAYMFKGIVHMYVITENGETFYTDNEHATIVK